MPLTRATSSVDVLVVRKRVEATPSLVMRRVFRVQMMARLPLRSKKLYSVADASPRRGFLLAWDDDTYERDKRYTLVMVN